VNSNNYNSNSTPLFSTASSSRIQPLSGRPQPQFSKRGKETVKKDNTHMIKTSNNKKQQKTTVTTVTTNKQQQQQQQ
jgi:hypothetical protein